VFEKKLFDILKDIFFTLDCSNNLGVNNILVKTLGLTTSWFKNMFVVLNLTISKFGLNTIVPSSLTK
jgi:hypothetical protein